MMYNKLDKTKAIKVADGYVTFTQSFRYLGSMVAYNLHNDDNVMTQIAAAKASMGALKEVWQNKHFNTYSKYLLFLCNPNESAAVGLQSMVTAAKPS